jgi:hypothetical protein
MHQRVDVVIDRNHRFPEMVDRLRSSGMHVERVLEVLGVVSGTASPEVLARIESLPGVKSTAVSEVYHVAPPEAGK